MGITSGPPRGVAGRRVSTWLRIRAVRHRGDAGGASGSRGRHRSVRRGGDRPECPGQRTADRRRPPRRPRGRPPDVDVSSPETAGTRPGWPPRPALATPGPRTRIVVLIGDPGRRYLPTGELPELAVTRSGRRPSSRTSNSSMATSTSAAGARCSRVTPRRQY